MSSDGPPIRWRDLLRETEQAVGDRRHARWICETATSTNPDEFAAMLDDFATERAVHHLDAMVARARSGEPIQYVLGSWGFRRLDLAVDRRVLIPRPETELVAGIAIDKALGAGPLRTVVDLGTGSGAIGLAMADELPVDGTTVWITDRSADALDVARSNLAGLGRAAVNVRIGHGSWFDPLPRCPAFDVIVSNPPYVAVGSPDLDESVAEWEPHDALLSGADGLDDIRTIVDGATERLRPGGWLVVEHGHDQGESVERLMVEGGLVEVATRPDVAGHARVTLGQRPRHLFDVPFGAGRLRVRHLSNEVDDYACLLRWLSTTDVLEWYEGRDQLFDLARILAEYGPGGVVEVDGTVPAIIELDDEPVGYIQLYDLARWPDEFELDGEPGGRDGVWSMDLYIGVPPLFGVGIGRAVCRSAATFLRAVGGARDVVIMPYVENARAIASYRAAGFEGGHVVREHELHEGVMRDGLRLHFRG